MPLTGTFKESTLTWFNQPGSGGRSRDADSREHAGYMEWDVTDHVDAMRETGLSYGWQVRDHHENDPEGGDQAFASRELLPDPPESFIPELVLVYEADGCRRHRPPSCPSDIEPTTVHCGQVLTEHTLVANDLTDCLGEGLVVGASNIVVDLNGHTIDGPDYILGNITGQEEGFPAGIRVSGHSNVIVRNGTVQQFGWGVLLTPGTTRVVVEDLDILAQRRVGVELFDADNGRTGNTIRNNTINDNELGITPRCRRPEQHHRGQHHPRQPRRGDLHPARQRPPDRGQRDRRHPDRSEPRLRRWRPAGRLAPRRLQEQHPARHRRRRRRRSASVPTTTASKTTCMYRNGDAGVYIQDSARNVVIGNTAHQESDGGVVLSTADGTVVKDNDLRSTRTASRPPTRTTS